MKRVVHAIALTGLMTLGAALLAAAPAAAGTRPEVFHQRLSDSFTTEVCGFTVNNVLKGKLLESDALVTQAMNNSKAQFASSPTLDEAILDAIMDALDAHRVDAVAVTNAAQVHNLFAVADSLGRGESLRAALDRTLIASIGPVASVALRRFRVGVALEASPPKLGPLIDALDAALSQTPPVAPHGASAAR